MSYYMSTTNTTRRPSLQEQRLRTLIDFATDTGHTEGRKAAYRGLAARRTHTAISSADKALIELLQTAKNNAHNDR